jgi:aminoglycoside phosphotransferase (APT) family kinase protein
MAHTHSLVFDGSLVTKTYTSWQRGEHRREWGVLCHLHKHAVDLAPRPVEAMLDARPPIVTMSRVAGEPFEEGLSEAQMAAFVDAVTRLWTVPHDNLTDLAPWRDDLDFGRGLTAGPRPAGGITAEAFDAALAWWQGPDPDHLRRRPAVTVLGHRDPNLANYLWDGRRVRMVDFEDAAISDPATELAIMMEHLSWRGVDADNLWARFDVDQGRLLAARRLWAMFWLWLVLPGGRSADRNPPGTAEQQAQRLLGLLDG